MSTVRQQRVAEQIQQEISALLVKGIKDPRVGFVTITGVEVSADLRVAWVYFSSTGSPGQRARSQQGLESAAGFIRRTLGKRLRLKTIPEFHFKYDESLERGAHIEKLLGAVRRAEGWDDPTRVRGSVADVARVIREARGPILVVSHSNPDGDAIASLLGMRLILLALGKRVQAYCPEPVPHNFAFLPGAAELAREHGPGPFVATIVLDCSELERCPLLPEADDLGKLVSIDHHLTSNPLGEAYYLDPGAAAIGELLEPLAAELGVEINQDLATCLYTSIVSDTGSFRYSNTSPRALQCAARMLERGVQPWPVAFQLYESQPVARVRLLGQVLQTLELCCRQQVAVITVTRAMIEQTGATLDMLDGFINYPRGIAGVEVAMQIREDEQRQFKFSFRSSGRVDVAEIASRFGGGGHRNAAGCTLTLPLDEARRQVISTIEEVLEQ